MHRVRVIAIDGPAGAGKSTVSRLVAERARLPFLDTGAMYRGVAFAAIHCGVAIDDEDGIGRIAESVVLELDADGLRVDGTDATAEIRGREVTAAVSVVATYSRVRTAMREQQRRWIESNGGGVVEGRDIGTVVFPDALLKVFLTATPRVRALRRVAQSGGDPDMVDMVDVVEREIAERDRIDSTRDDSPLRPAEDAVVVDSSEMPAEEVVRTIVELFRERDERHAPMTGANGNG